MLCEPFPAELDGGLVVCGVAPSATPWRPAGNGCSPLTLHPSVLADLSYALPEAYARVLAGDWTAATISSLALLLRWRLSALRLFVATERLGWTVYVPQTRSLYGCGSRQAAPPPLASDEVVVVVPLLVTLERPDGVWCNGGVLLVRPRVDLLRLLHSMQVPALVFQVAPLRRTSFDDVAAHGPALRLTDAALGHAA
jgi:hypothetical protein